jgi:hypothetical protein
VSGSGSSVSTSIFRRTSKSFTVPVEGFEYLWDRSGELMQQGIVPASAAVDDRLIAAHGLSRPAAEPRKDSRSRRRTLGPVSVVASSERLPYDRGHAIGHALCTLGNRAGLL